MKFHKTQIIYIYMMYIIPKFDCVLYNSSSIELKKNTQYCVENVENSNYIIFGKNNELPYIINFFKLENCEYVTKAKIGNNTYVFLYSKCLTNFNVVNFKFLNSYISISLLDGLNVAINGIVILQENVYNITYSHYEIVGDMCIIYFKGKRNYFVIVKENELICSSFYDELNIDGNEQYYMCKLQDSLNHGRVFHIKDKIFENYLVYLDDFDLNLKPEFVGNIFVDCLMNKNLKYCNEMLVEDLKHTDETSLLKFFVDFDDYFCASNTDFIMLKKNTLAGIYRFEYLNNQISNIIQLD